MCLWVAVGMAMPVWMAFDAPGWDVGIYHRAMQAVALGRDPYADAMAVQEAFHREKASHPDAEPPYSYVYSPMTLPLVRGIGVLPGWLSGSVYWLVYLAGVLGEVWVGMWAVEEGERKAFLFVAPVAAFFPGLLANGIVLSGNVAYVLYAVALVAAVHAWRGGSWRWFYGVVLAASCVKAPLLTLLVIPLLSARRQWVWAGMTTAVGAGLFAAQPLVWPVLFRHYLQAVELQFSYNRDFGCSPAGIFSGLLYDRGIPYAPASFFFYLAYALPMFGWMVYLSRRYLRGEFSQTQWLPVLFVGVILLNPRLIEYDVAPLAIPLALIGWRFLNAVMVRSLAVVCASVLFAAANSFALSSWELRKVLDGAVLVMFFVAGSWTLIRESRGIGGFAVADAGEDGVYVG